LQKDGFADVERLNVHEVGEAIEINGSIVVGHRGPAGLAERLLRGAHRRIHIARVPGGEAGNYLSIAWIARFRCPTSCRGYSLAVDELPDRG
jgi:hypothetical protein